MAEESTGNDENVFKTKIYLFILEVYEPAADEVTDGTDQTISMYRDVKTYLFLLLNFSDRLIVHEFDSNAASRYNIIPSRICVLHINFRWHWLMLILMGFTISHSLYWLISVLIGLVMYVINAIRFPVWTYDNRFRVQLGHTQPWPSNCEILS
jgi:hypothetical protein